MRPDRLLAVRPFYVCGKGAGQKEICGEMTGLHGLCLTG